MKNIRDFLGNVMDFIIKYKRYFMAGLVCLCMLVVLFKFTDSTPVTEEVDPMEGVYQDYTENENEELATLIQNYYDACASGDTDTIQTLATPVCDQEISYLSFYSQYIESYTVEKLYTKRGLTDDSYIVSAVIELKFQDIDTSAPGVDFFYVETNDDGALYINNLYGSFNQSNGVYDLDSDITSLIATFIQQDDVLALEAEVQQSYNEAILSDDNLNNFVSNTLQTALAQWSSDYQASVEAAAAEEEAAEAEATEETAEEETTEATEETVETTTGTTTSKINVRAEADKESTRLGQLDEGSSVTIYGEDGDWYQIGYGDTKGYVLKEYISTGDTAADSDDTATTSTSSFAEGTEITLSDTINIRSAMDSSSSKVAVAYAGEKVTVVMSYAEGWTKVKYGKKEGYIRTDLLK